MMLTENAPPATHVHAVAAPAVNRARTVVPPPNPPRWRRWLLPAVYVAFFAILGAVGLWYRHELAELFDAPSPKGGPPRVEPVAVLGPGLVAVVAGTPLEQRLRVVSVVLEKIDYPLLSVTGSVI